MRTDIFIVTYARDFRYLGYCLESIQKFAKGFSTVHILVPEQDYLPLVSLTQEHKGPIPITCSFGQEWKGEGKGFLWHAYMILRAEHYCDKADFIYHFDPDCIFTAPVTPETFFKDGKPVLRFESYESLGKRHPGVLLWQHAVNQCLPFAAYNETMRAHCMIYHRGLYRVTRKLIEEKTGKPCGDYIHDCKGTFPQTFAEFPTLGAVAMEKFPDRYSFHDCAKQANPDFQNVPVFQAWSHASPDVPVALWRNGEQTTFAPITVYKELGLA